MSHHLKECALHSSRVAVLSFIVLAAVFGMLLLHFTGAAAVYAQEPTETPAPPTNTPQPTATATPFPTNTPEPTWTPAPTWTPVPTNTPLPTNSPVPTNTPPPTFTPVPVEQRVAPGGAIFINCGPGEPCIDLHSSHTDISVDELAVLSFSIVNSLGKPAMLSRLILELPSGWSMDGEGFADKCSGLCSANYTIPTGEQEFIEVSAYPNHVGTFRLAGRIEWAYEGTVDILHLSRDVRISVTAGGSGNENRVEPLPTTPPQPTATAAASPQQQPTAPPVGGTASVGCSAPPPDARVLDPGLLLLAGLLFPGIAIRRLWKWKHGSRSSP